MPAPLELAIQKFASHSLKQSALDFWKTLGYESNRTIELDTSPQTFAAQFNLELPFIFCEIALLFQLSSDSIQQLRGQNALFSGEFEASEEKSYIFLALKLDDSQSYSRTQLSNFARLLNKPFGAPVLLLIHHGDLLSLAVVDRRPNKLDASRDVLEKVTLLKDIRLDNPHGGQLKILRDLQFENIVAANWEQLHLAWKRVLDLNELNRKFFGELSDWYFYARSQVVFPSPDGDLRGIGASVPVIRLITRVMFAYFLKERDLVPAAIFDANEMQSLLEKTDAESSSYYQAVLQNLFFATLNTEIAAREWMPENSGGRNAAFMVHNKRRYRDFFADENKAQNLFARVPFLNGGLFECLDKRLQKPDGTEFDERFDGFSQKMKNPLRVPNALFWGEAIEADLNADYGTKNKNFRVRPLLEIFARYKFTVSENTPLEEEVALDPELLGKVFENLLASYNPETASTARKQTGSFYTPREIVDYMVEESLVAYLKTATDVDESTLRALFIPANNATANNANANNANANNANANNANANNANANNANANNAIVGAGGGAAPPGPGGAE